MERDERGLRARGRRLVAERSRAFVIALSVTFLVSCGGRAISHSEDGRGGDSNAAGAGASSSSGGSMTGGVASRGGSSSVERCTGVPSGFPRTVELSLDEFCSTFDCQRTLEAAMLAEQTSCGDLHPPVLVRGCGSAELGRSHAYGSSWRIFDPETERLIGAEVSSDTTFGPCDAAIYVAGARHSDCEEAVACSICLPSESICSFD